MRFTLRTERLSEWPMADDAIRLFRMLVDAGAKPGEDFSYDLHSESAQLSDLAFEKLKVAYPDIDWDHISERVEVDPSLPAAYLDSYLGVDFVAQILALIEQRLDELVPEQATWYLQQLLSGVEQKTGVPLYLMLQQRLPLARQARLETLLRSPASPCTLWMSDLITAAGGQPEDVELNEDEVVLTERGLSLLTAVWDGEYNLVEEEDG